MCVALVDMIKGRYPKARLPNPPVRPVRETFASYGSRERDIMGRVHFASSTVHSHGQLCAFAGYLCTISRPAPSGPLPCARFSRTRTTMPYLTACRASEFSLEWVGSGRVTIRHVSPIPPLEPCVRLLSHTAHEIGNLW